MHTLRRCFVRDKQSHGFALLLDHGPNRAAHVLILTITIACSHAAPSAFGPRRFSAAGLRFELVHDSGRTRYEIPQIPLPRGRGSVRRTRTLAFARLAGICTKKSLRVARPATPAHRQPCPDLLF